MFLVLPLLPLGYQAIQLRRLGDNRLQLSNQLLGFPLLIIGIISYDPRAVRGIEIFWRLIALLPQTTRDFKVEAVLDVKYGRSHIAYLIVSQCKLRTEYYSGREEALDSPHRRIWSQDSNGRVTK